MKRKENLQKIAFGGGCHWCTEAVFQSLKGVALVEQGYVSSRTPNTNFSEAVIVHYNKQIIPFKVLLEIHLLTHNSRSNHSMRKEYRSAVYVYNDEQYAFAKAQLDLLQSMQTEKYITQVLYLEHFRPSREAIQNYYQKDPKRPFCKRYISPKLDLLRMKYADVVAD